MSMWNRIDSRIRAEGLFELLESECEGDERPCVVRLNGSQIGQTWDSLDEFIDEYLEGCV